ncbi:dienelactone hydrolase family protein [Actinopolymorpha alba]|uniref:dienelactone hydrolase family protein n=1 Tax=Actinopolymorpha alba TaxID=533267 RepID=UPI00036215E6|nr:alpha/beta family hydrolase [Actinopolymorpha alba]
MSVPVAVEVGAPAEGVRLLGDLVVPQPAYGVVLFAHGSGSSRHSPRNRAVAKALQDGGFATVLLDLLTAEEEERDYRTAELRFDIGLLSRRLISTADQLREWESTRDLPLGIFGASTGAASALVAAAERPESVRAVVSRGGRPDLAGTALRRVRAPTLLIVGGADHHVLRLNQQAAEQLSAPHELRVVPGATHLFEEPGTLEQVALHAADWCDRYLRQTARAG